MRKVIITLCLLFSGVALSAQTTAREWIDAMNETLGERFAYNLTVTVGQDSESLYGTLMVEGDSYYMELGSMEVYSDGHLRYEVNNERREVTEDRVDLESRDLLTNPTRAFDFLDEEFTMTIDAANRITLVPRDPNIGYSTIYLFVERRDNGVEPESIVYDYEGDSVTVGLMSYTPDEVGESHQEWVMPRWDARRYRAYDMVSFL